MYWNPMLTQPQSQSKIKGVRGNVATMASLLSLMNCNNSFSNSNLDQPCVVGINQQMALILMSWWWCLTHSTVKVNNRLQSHTPSPLLIFWWHIGHSISTKNPVPFCWYLSSDTTSTKCSPIYSAQTLCQLERASSAFFNTAEKGKQKELAFKWVAGRETAAWRT